MSRPLTIRGTEMTAPIEPPWRLGEPDESLLRAAKHDPRDKRAEAHLDHACELITQAYIAENMGDHRAFVRDNYAALEYLNGLAQPDLVDMVAAIVCNHASKMAAIATTIPDHIPADLAGGADV